MMVSPGSNRGGLSRVSTRGGVAGPGSPRASPAATAFAALRRRWRWAPPGSSTLERAARAFLLASAALVLSCALYLYVLRYVGRGGLESVDRLNRATLGGTTLEGPGQTHGCLKVRRMLHLDVG